MESPPSLTILDLIHDASCCPQPVENSMLSGAVERLKQKDIDDWRDENGHSAVFGSNSPEIEDLSSMFDD
jgi:hypothetical protein